VITGIAMTDTYYSHPKRTRRAAMTTGNTYKVIELVGSSSDGVQEAIDGAISRAGETIQDLDWFEVKEIRGNIMDGNVTWYQVKVAIGFRVLSPEDLQKE
jgi:flavin-binding protein dodecin